MENEDLRKQEREKITRELSAAVQSNDPQRAAEALAAFQDSIAKRVEREFEQYKNTSDMAVLQSRGLRALTSEEEGWYQKFMSAVRSGARQEIANLTEALPLTIIDKVIEDMKKAHPLLSEITLQDAAGSVRLVMNGVQMASKLGSWGPITGAITQEVTGQIKTIDVTASKYTAFFLIPKDFVKFNFGFAPMWVDQYIRIILGEVIANGLEKTIIDGDGKEQFIGMTMNVAVMTDGAYAQKAPVALKNWQDDYAAIISRLMIDSNGDYRDVPEVLLVVNPIDNVRKIRKAQRAITVAGILDLINQTHPTKIVASAFMPRGRAALGIARNYFAAINGGTSGIVEYSDEYQFLEDNRVYTTRIYGYGRPVDNTSFVYLDITGVEDPSLPVSVVKNTSEGNPLEALRVDADIDGSVDLLGKSVSDLQDGVVVGDGNITGQLKYISGYTGFSSKAAERNGNFIALHAEVPGVSGVKITATVTKPTTLDDDGIVVLKIADKVAQTITFTASLAGYPDVTRVYALNEMDVLSN